MGKIIQRELESIEDPVAGKDVMVSNTSYWMGTTIPGNTMDPFATGVLIPCRFTLERIVVTDTRHVCRLKLEGVIYASGSGTILKTCPLLGLR